MSPISFNTILLNDERQLEIRITVETNDCSSQRLNFRIQLSQKLDLRIDIVVLLLSIIIIVVIMTSCPLDNYLAALRLSSSAQKTEYTTFVIVDDNVKATPWVSNRISARGINRTQSLPAVSRPRIGGPQLESRTSLVVTGSKALKLSRWENLVSDGTRKTWDSRNQDQSATIPTRSIEDVECSNETHKHSQDSTFQGPTIPPRISGRNVRQSLPYSLRSLPY